MQQQARKRRLSSGAACSGCRKRKNRCDGHRPECENCVGRGLRCSYPSKLVSQLSIEELKSYMNQKLRTVSEESGNISQRQIAPSLPAHAINVPSESSELSGPTITESPTAQASPLLVSHTIDRDPSESKSRNDTAQVVQVESAKFQHRSHSPEPAGYFGPSSTFDFVAKVLPGGSQHSNDIQEEYNRRSASNSTAQESLFPSTPIIPTSSNDEGGQGRGLPERDLADRLLDAYFNCVHPLYPFVHESTFRDQYDRLWQPDSPDFQPEWLAILNMAFANGCEFCESINREQVLPMASVFVSRARTLLAPRLFQPGNLARVQALLLLCHYLQGTLDLCECWNLVGVMVRTAVSIGLHLSVTDDNRSNAVQKEMAKRVWCGCYIIDRTLSMKFGRPLSIQILNIHDTPLPLEVDDRYITPGTLAPRQPTGRPSLTGFFIQTIKLTGVIDCVLKELYSGPALRLSLSQELDFVALSENQHRVMGYTASLDARLLSWWNLVPKHLREEPAIPDSIDYQRQRNVIYIRFLNLRILVHRQALLIFSQQNIEDPFQRAIAAASSKACILAAKRTIELIHSQYHRQLLNSITYNLHYVFTAMGVLLTLETMNEASLKELEETNFRETLDLGMQFLLATSHLSILAGRYVTMLRKLKSNGQVLPKPSQGLGGSDPSGMRDRNEGSKSRDQNMGSTLSSETISSPWTGQTLQAQVSGAASDYNDPEQDMGLDLLDIDFSDFLYGTGLPRDFISGQWPMTE